MTALHSPTDARAEPAAVSQPQRLSSLALGLAVSLGLACVAGRAYPQTGQCGPHANVVDRLAAQYGEARVSMGLTANGFVMGTFANGSNGSWTITVTDTAGMTCLIAAGTGFDDIDSKPGVDG